MNVPAADFELESQKISLASGQSQNLSVSWLPWNAKAQTVTWSSDNENIAVVNANGKVTAVSGGTTTIRASAVIGGTLTERTMEVEVVKTSDSIYGYVVVDYKNAANGTSWGKIFG